MTTFNTFPKKGPKYDVNEFLHFFVYVYYRKKIALYEVCIEIDAAFV